MKLLFLVLFFFYIYFRGGPPQNIIPSGSSPNPASISPQTPSVLLGGASINLELYFHELEIFLLLSVEHIYLMFK